MTLHNGQIDMPVAILAGGLATRMRPLTETVPKVLLEVGGKPFLEHQLAYLSGQGIRDVVLCVGFLGEMIREHFADGSAYGINLRYSFDGPTLLGTGGAIRQALPLLGDTFFVLYGDSYLRIDFADVARVFSRSQKGALMTVFRNEDQWDKSNVSLCDGEIRCYDKKRSAPDMRYIDYGLTAFRASIFDEYSAGAAFELETVLQTLVSRGQLAGYEARHRFYEIGSPAGLSELNTFLTTTRAQISS